MLNTALLGSFGSRLAFRVDKLTYFLQLHCRWQVSQAVPIRPSGVLGLQDLRRLASAGALRLPAAGKLLLQLRPVGLELAALGSIAQEETLLAAAAEADPYAALAAAWGQGQVCFLPEPLRECMENCKTAAKVNLINQICGMMCHAWSQPCNQLEARKKDECNIINGLLCLVHCDTKSPYIVGCRCPNLAGEHSPWLAAGGAESAAGDAAWPGDKSAGLPAPGAAPLSCLPGGQL